MAYSNSHVFSTFKFETLSSAEFGAIGFNSTISGLKYSTTFTTTIGKTADVFVWVGDEN